MNIICILFHLQVTFFVYYPNRKFNIHHVHPNRNLCGFDAPIRARRNPKRKSAVVSKPNEPARGCMPVRQYHRRDESKILPHGDNR
jgi:hypothetical protein